MAITRRTPGALAMGTWGNLAGTDIPDVPLPGDLAEGDLMLLIVFSRRGNITIAAPGDWTDEFNQSGAEDADSMRWAIFSKFAGASEATPDVDFGAAGTGPRNAFILAYAGVDTGTPLDQMPGGVSLNGSAQNIGPITGFTPASTVGAILVLGGKGDDWTSVATLSGESLTWNELLEATTTEGNDAGLVANDALDWSSGAIANKTFTVTGGAAAFGTGLMFGLNDESLMPVGGAVTNVKDTTFSEAAVKFREGGVFT